MICLFLRKSEDYIKLEVENELIRKEMIIITSKGREINPDNRFTHQNMVKNTDKKITETDKNLAIAWLRDRKQITEKLGKRYLELVNQIAEIIAKGDLPDNYDFGSFSDDIPVKESIKNNYLEDL
jgi:hypothetical protein